MDDTTEIKRQIQIRIDAEPGQRSARHPAINLHGLHGDRENHSNQQPSPILETQATGGLNERLGNQVARAAARQGAEQLSLCRLRFTWCKAGSVPAARASGPDLHQASPRRRGVEGDARRGACRIARSLGRARGEEEASWQARRLLGEWVGVVVWWRPGRGAGGDFIVGERAGARGEHIRLSPTIPPSNFPQTYYLLYFTTSLQKIPSPITPSLQPFPPIYLWFLNFKKIIQYLYCHNTHYHHVTGLKHD